MIRKEINWGKVVDDEDDEDNEGDSLAASCRVAESCDSLTRH